MARQVQRGGGGVPRRGLGLARVLGASMEPTLRSGDLLVVRWGTRPAAGRLALVDLPGDRPLSVKRLAFRTPDGWWVERDNPAVGVDSWLVGAVAEDDVRAVVLLRLPRLRAPRVTCRAGGWSHRGGPLR